MIYIAPRIAQYLLEHLNEKTISTTKMTKLLYLVDWKGAIELGKQISSARWEYQKYGPYSEGLLQSLFDYPGIGHNVRFVLNTNDPYVQFKHKRGSSSGITRKEVTDVIDHTIRYANMNDYTDLLKLVYSTFPIFTGNLGDELDLVDLAKEYAKVKHLL